MSDDQFYNSKEDKEPLLIHSDLSLIDDNGQLLENSHNKLINNQKNFISKNTALYYNAVPGCALSINSALADKISYNKNMVMHDWWILLSAINLFFPIPYISPKLIVLACFRSMPAMSATT